MSNSNPFHVLIIGGGIGGLSLALFLKKAGISCSVHEAFPYQDNVGGGFNIAPNGMNVLAALGLDEEVILKGIVTQEHYFRNEKGRVLAHMGNGNPKKYGQPGVSISHATLYKLLIEEIKAHGIEVQYEKKLSNITQDVSRVTAYFEDGSSAKGNILIGADGIHSKTRSLVFPEGPQPEYLGQMNVGGFTPISALPMLTEQEQNSLNYTFGPKGFFGYCMADNDMMMWWANVPKERETSKQELQVNSLVEAKIEMMGSYLGYHEPIRTLIANSERIQRLNMADIPSMPNWHQGRVLLIGDAAHAVSANAGQGVSMALEDAMYLAKLLQQRAGSYERIFERFETDRKPRVEKIMQEGRRRGADKKMDGPIKAKVRELMMSMYITLFGERQLDWLYKYKIDVDQPSLTETY